MERFKLFLLHLGLLTCIPGMGQDYSSPVLLDSKTNSHSSYLEKWDFDGDGEHDSISFQFSGGAHCCYQMSLKLSSRPDTLSFPFEMDGGYLLGRIDGSKPEQFNIKDYDQDGKPEIFMLIATYNGIQYPIDKTWTEKFGIQNNTILFDVLGKEVIVKDYYP